MRRSSGPVGARQIALNRELASVTGAEEVLRASLEQLRARLLLLLVLRLELLARLLEQLRSG